MATTDDRTTDDRTTDGRGEPPRRRCGPCEGCRRSWSPAPPPAMAASGVAPFFQLVAPCVNPAGACIRKEAGYGFLVRVCGQGNQSAYLYSVTIMSPQVSDLTFDSIEPPLGRGITPGNCTNTFFNARTSTLPPAIFTATISVTCGPTLPIGSDTDTSPW
ncbi:MAG: hypothetical protein ACHP7G_04570 [Actinomycetales bacterium]